MEVKPDRLSYTLSVLGGDGTADQVLQVAAAALREGIHPSLELPGDLGTGNRRGSFRNISTRARLRER